MPLARSTVVSGKNPGPQYKSLPLHLRIRPPASPIVSRGTWRRFQTNFLLLRAEFHRSSFLRYVTFQFYVGFISWPFVGSLFRDRNRFCRIRKKQGHQPLICWLHVHPELCNPFGRNVAFLLLYIVFDVNCGILLIEKRCVFF